MLIPTGQTNENHDPPRRPPNNIPTITKAIDSDTRYTCLLPPDWNGGLVMYLQPSSRPPLANSLCQEWFRRGGQHGDQQGQNPLANSLCQEWFRRGYALAIAQYSGKGQLDQAGHHRRQLLSFFARRCGTPQQVCEISDTPGENPPTYRRVTFWTGSLFLTKKPRFRLVCSPPACLALSLQNVWIVES